MAEPNPVWGVHVVEGAVTAALVRRTETGGFVVLDALADRAPEDAADAMRQARALLSRRAVAAPGALVTLPDANGSLVSATVPSDQFDLSDHEIANEMFEWTRFEPDAAELRHSCVLREPRQELRIVAAIPRQDYRRLLEVLETGDVGRLGVGLSGVATWRGASALGLVPADGFLVAVLPHATEVFAAPGGRVRRHVLPLGEAELTRDATAADVLARDLAQLADYHRSLRKSGERPPAEPRFALAGLSATSPAVRPRLAGALGPRLVEGRTCEAQVTVAEGVKLPNASVAALAGAVGAALEALRPTSERLVLRHLPADLPPFRSRAPLVAAAAAAAMLVAVALAYERFFDATHGSGRDVADAGRTPSRPPSPVAPEPRLPASPPPPAPPPRATIPALDAEVVGEGRVRVRWPKSSLARTLTRRRVDANGAELDPPAVVCRLDASAGDTIDDVPGPGGLYVWSAEGATDARAAVEIRVEAELLGPGDAGGARFALRRPWRGGEATLDVDVAPGARIAGNDGPLTFDTGCRLDVVRQHSQAERAAVLVPRFLADGRIERGADGTPLTAERVVERLRRVFEADAVLPDGTRRTWPRIEK